MANDLEQEITLVLFLAPMLDAIRISGHRQRFSVMHGGKWAKTRT
jgi:hypothetical protein